MRMYLVTNAPRTAYHATELSGIYYGRTATCSIGTSNMTVSFCSVQVVDDSCCGNVVGVASGVLSALGEA